MSVEWIPRKRDAHPIGAWFIGASDVVPPTEVLEEKEKEERQIVVRERETLSLTDKVLVAGFILNVVTFLWGVYEWQKSREKKK